MIDKLKMQKELICDGEVEIEHSPSIIDIVNKINEVVENLNHMQKEYDELCKQLYKIDPPFSAPLECADDTPVARHVYRDCNMMNNNSVVGIEFDNFNNNKCPKCGYDEFSVLHRTSTLLHIPETYKNGALQESDSKNITETKVQCIRCGHTWEV